jgi:hypothetical protein
MGMRNNAVPSVLMCGAELGQAAVETGRLGQEGGLEGREEAKEKRGLDGPHCLARARAAQRGVCRYR